MREKARVTRGRGCGREWNVCFATLLFLFASVLPLLAQNPGTGPANTTIEEVIVTGSNIPTAEEVQPNPVDTYRRTDLTNMGVRSATDFILKLPAVMGAALNENNVNGGDGRTEINLRGILPKETLVLQDGRRLAPVGFAGDTVDLNVFPIGLIDHVDLLKDGASAIYGADAVAGVVNVWLIHKFRGLEIYNSYGNTNLGFANDQDEERAYILAGSGDDKTELVMFAEFYNRAALFSRDTDISHDADFVPFGGIDTRSGNFAGRVGGFVYQPSRNGGARTPTPHAFLNAAGDPEYVPLTSLSRERRLFNFADITPAMGQADREYFYGAFERKICDEFLVAFGDFKFVRTFWEGGLAPAPFTPDVFTDINHASGISTTGISVPTQNPFNPFTAPDYVSPGGFDPKLPGSALSAAPPGTQFTTGVRYRGLEAGLRSDQVTTDNYELTAGLKGVLGEFGDGFKTWQWEAGFRYNEDHRTEQFGGIVNTATLRAALLDTDPGTAFNPFGINRNSHSVLDTIFVPTNRVGTTSLALADLKLNGDLFSLPAGPVAFALGGESRAERATDIPDVLTAANQTLGASNFGPTRGNRNVWSTYWELRVPITSASWNAPGFYSLELGYQERYENFSDFGAAVRPKFFGRWQPLDSCLTFRATYSEAFHAPTLSDLFRGSTQSGILVNDPRSPATGSEVLGQFGGNPNLQPETAYEWTYGAVLTPGKWWEPLQGLTLMADFYHIDIRAVTVLLDPQFLIDHESQFRDQVIRGPSTGPNDPFGPIILLLLSEHNLGRMIQEGWDYEAVYSFETSRLGHGDWGNLTLTVNGTYLDRAVLQSVAGGPERVVVGKYGGGFAGLTAGGAFTHNRWYASLFYEAGANSTLQGVNTGFTLHYIGQYWDNATLTFNGNDRKIREWTTLDWIANYTLSFPAPAAPNEVPGSAGRIRKNANGSAFTAEYRPGGWRAWLNNTTLTFGVNNLANAQPPFVAAAFENGYDESTTNIRGRVWYVAIKKRF